MQAIAEIGKEEGLKGYWKGNRPQVLDIPHHADCGSCMVYFILLVLFSLSFFINYLRLSA